MSHIVCQAQPRWGYRPGETLMVLDCSPTMTRMHAGEFSRLPAEVRAAMLAKAPQLKPEPSKFAPERIARGHALTDAEKTEIARRADAGERWPDIAAAMGRGFSTIKQFLRKREATQCSTPK